MAENITGLLEKIGYSYFKVEKSVSIEDGIIQILLGKEKRFLKAIPFIIYIATKNASLSFNWSLLLEKAREKKVIHEVKAVLGVALDIFTKIEPENTLIPSLKKIVSKKKESSFVFSFDEYLYDFIAQKKLYEAEQQIGLAEKINKAKEYDFQYALANLFKPKQREIIQKIIDNKQLTKMEYDYYFKTIKKRLRAVKLLGDFADTVIQKKVSKELEIA
ncbi:hypothetical protein HZC31_03595 [Candidatus Woesearchaeota archaeon]|nr:hypothetical protein [Candidatus Woesearchaeota archaeon]